MKFEVVTVECYSGYKVNEKPVSFIFRGEKYLITEVVDQWYEGSVDAKLPKINYFKVKTESGAHHLLQYNELFDKWSIMLEKNNI